jgi:hypothetical protein
LKAELENPPGINNKISHILEIDFQTLMTAWLKERIIHEVGKN